MRVYRKRPARLRLDHSWTRISYRTVLRNRATLKDFHKEAKVMARVREIVKQIEAYPTGRHEDFCDAYRGMVLEGMGIVSVHLSPAEPACDHKWNNGGDNPTHCEKCGYSFTRYVNGLGF